MTVNLRPGAKALSPTELMDLAGQALEGGRATDAERLLRVSFRAGGLVRGAVNLTVALEAQGRHREAVEVFRAALALMPGEAQLEARLGLSLLRLGEFPEGLALMERRPVQMAGNIAPGRPKLSYPEWTGQTVRSLLILPEQGFGDLIQYARYAPLLQSRGVEVTLLCPPQMMRLFAPLGVRLIPASGRAALPPCDAWVLAPSLPLRVGTMLETVPSEPYLPGGDGGVGVGVVARGNPGHTNDANRSLDAGATAKLLALPGARSLLQDHTGAADFEDTRAIIEQLELVISVDTAIAHLAGAMGKPTWLLLPFNPDWRWMLDRADSPWYPSMRLFRQRAPADWDSVIADVLTELGDRHG